MIFLVWEVDFAVIRTRHESSFLRILITPTVCHFGDRVGHFLTSRSTMTGKKQMSQKCGQPWENRGWKIIYLNQIPHPQVQPQF